MRTPKHNSTKYGFLYAAVVGCLRCVRWYAESQRVPLDSRADNYDWNVRSFAEHSVPPDKDYVLTYLDRCGVKSTPEAAADVSDAAVNTDEVSPPPPPLRRRLPEVVSNVSHDCIDTHGVPPPRQCPDIWSHGSVHEDRLADTLFEAAAVGCVDSVHYLVIFTGVDPEQPGTNDGEFIPLQAAEFQGTR